MKLENLTLLLLIQLMLLGCSKEEISVDFSKPVITTLYVSAITNTNAICGGNVINDGGKTITSKGFVWHISTNATLETNIGKTTDSKGEFTVKSDNINGGGLGEDDDDNDKDGTESNEFTHELTGLTMDTKYFVRAYATNELGTVYGAEREFTTANHSKPVITTSEVFEINNTTATCGGNIISDGGDAITARGLVWHISAHATLEKNTGKTTDGIELGEFTSKLVGLTMDTKYFVRAYAINEFGTVYGEEIEFTTTNYTKPAMTTLEVSEITISTATCGGDISSDGGLEITARGLVWDTASQATLESNTGRTTDGTDAGEFISKLSGLSLDTKYFVRAYATNDLGTVYGEEKEFTTRLCRVEMLKGDIALLMTPIEGGTFDMGSIDGRADEIPIHSVSLSPYEIGKYEVTQSQWKAVMDGANPSYFKGDNLPVEDVSWVDIQEFISRLNDQTGLNYRLPTEAEWEFAARGGTKGSTTEFSGSNTIEDVAWCRNNSGFKTHEVGGKQANVLGIFDMTGNVWEWCNDWYSAYETTDVTNPQGPSSATTRVYRGGGWGHSSSYCRIAIRNHSYPSDGLDYIGFRLARSIE